MHTFMHMQKERTTISLPPGLRERAHKAEINISAVAAIAVLRHVKSKERQGGEHGNAALAQSEGA